MVIIKVFYQSAVCSLYSIAYCRILQSQVGMIKIAHANTLILLTWKEICRLFEEVFELWRKMHFDLSPFLLVHDSMGFRLAGPLLRTHNPLTFPSHIHTNSPLIWSSHAEGPARDKGRTQRLAGRVCVWPLSRCEPTGVRLCWPWGKLSQWIKITLAFHTHLSGQRHLLAVWSDVFLSA